MKGIVATNFIYLFLFYIIYFSFITLIKPYFDGFLQYMLPLIQSSLNEQGINIEDPTQNPNYQTGKMIMDGILYIGIPLVALIYTIKTAAVQREYEY